MVSYPRGDFRIFSQYQKLIFVARTPRQSLASKRMATLDADLIRQAVLQARSGQPKEALGLLLAHPPGPSSADASHYHLTVGSLLLDQGRPGEAFAHLDVVLHREGLIKPADDLWLTAREQAELKLGRGSLERASNTIEKWVDNPFYLPLEAFLAVLSVAAVVRCYRKGALPSSRKIWIRWAVLIWALAFGAGAGQILGSRYPRSRAATEITLRSGPAEDFYELGRVDAGSELRILEKNDGWVRVRVTPTVSGWVPSASVLLLTPPSTTRES
ncbi:MAG: SH3 domain-containing protein [Bdellovibrionales bacterium]|nr:SH3 domain-containing protein [Bdellovibrionales bacterium]